MLRFKSGMIATLVLGGLALTPVTSLAQAQDNVMVVFDGSNSMWGQIDGTAKIEIARDVMDNLLGGWTDERAVGLMAYGHRTRGDCTDIETLIAPAQGTRDEILKQIRGITPTGKTPLSDAVEQAAKALSYTDAPATVILISDGLESCDRDPCALAEALEKGGVGFTAHVVGFGLGGDADTASLSCIAENTGGQFLSAGNADELGKALSAVSTAVAEAPEPEPVKEPEPEPEPELPQVAVTGPNVAVIGSLFEVSWDPAVDKRDYLTIVPVGTDEGEYGNTLVTRDKVAGDLRAPADPGQYEIRYVARESRKTLGATPIEIVDANVTVSAPETALKGSFFKVSWTGAVDRQDYITIVPAGAEEGTYGNNILVRDKADDKLRAPAETGLHEIRYILREGSKTLARQSIEITEPEVTVSGPATALTGETIKVSWTGTVDRGDYISIVPAGAEEGTFGNNLLVRDETEGKLKTPAETGLYEIRYILREGSLTLASQPIEITEPEVTVSGPESAMIGARFKVAWTGAVDKGDYVAIVPAGSDEGTFGNYLQVRDNTDGELQAPAETGLYELRYILREGNKTMATQPIEVVAAEVTISGPESVQTGAVFKLSWTGMVDKSDYAAIVPVGADEGTFGNYIQVRGESEGKIKAPSDPGLYELRYILNEGHKTMATQPIEVVAAEVAISGPESAAAGSQVRVNWTGGVDKYDYVAIVPLGSDEGTFGNYKQVGDNSELDLVMPGTPGMYELRYILNEGQKTLATQPIEAVEKTIELSAPDQVRLGDTLKVGWAEVIHRHDYINLVPMGAEDDTFGSYKQVGDRSETELNMPEAEGVYELRYVLRDNNRVVGRRMIEVLAADAALNTGASLEAPTSGAPGAVIDVGWSVAAESADQRITLAKADQAIFTWISAVKIEGAPPVQITLPNEPGSYELRILDVSNQAVLARQVITVE